MRRALPVLCVAGLLAGCPKAPEKLAQLHVTCDGKTLDGTTQPPDTGQACAAGTRATLSYDNDGKYGYVTVFAITRDNIVFFLPDTDTGDSVAIQAQGHGVSLPGSFVIPTKTRDVMALFTREPLHAKDVAQHTRDVKLAEYPGTEIRVRLSREVGPVD